MMPEQSVYFKAGELKLHGMFSAVPENSAKGSPHPAAVICHPHPTYGGTMDNNVVLAVARALQDTGHSTLRFNFRGVEHSEGQYSDGIGEVEDVHAAIQFVQEKAGTGSPVVLAGYSFGSWVAVNALGDDAYVSHVILVAPPTSMFDFSGLTADKEERARHIIVGERDQFCDHDKLQSVFEQLPEPKTMRVIPRADHFFFGRESVLIEAIKEALLDHTAM